MITLYKTKHCAYCVMVAKYLTNRGKQFEEVYLDDNPTKRQELAALTGAMTVPITTDGQRYVIGWNVKELKELADEN